MKKRKAILLYVMPESIMIGEKCNVSDLQNKIIKSR